MAEDTPGVHGIYGHTNPNRLVDVVFVHGLGGSSHSTWRHGRPGEPDHFFWPYELGVDLPACGVWVFGYLAGFSDFGEPGMRIELRAGNMADQLAVKLGDRPVVLVTHSMGGLVSKAMVVRCEGSPDAGRARLERAVRGIVFCATPHKGSALAGVMSALGVAQDHVKQMGPNEAALDALHAEFVAWEGRRHVPLLPFAENQAMSGRFGFLGRKADVKAVTRESADPEFAEYPLRDVDADHGSIVKPPSREGPIGGVVYQGVLQFIRDVVRNVEAERTAAVTSSPQPVTATSPETTHPTSPPRVVAPLPSSGPGTEAARRIWAEKLEFYEQEFAITSDMPTKFSLKKKMEEARRELERLGGSGG